MRHRTRVKYCGITRLADAEYATSIGVDALGFVFYPKSKRYIDPTGAQAIIRQLPPFVTTVGLFVDHANEAIESIAEATGIDLIQFHGREEGSSCDAISKPYIKAILIRGPGDKAASIDESKNATTPKDLNSAIEPYTKARGILLDTFVPGTVGGTGQTFDWTGLPSDSIKPLILAGGLTAENVGSAIDQLRPYGVDVSSGIESSPGIKDKDKMTAFLKEVRRADEQLRTSAPET